MELPIASVVSETSSIPLFCSFTACLRLVYNEEVSVHDLSSGLFAFACTRYHVFDDKHTEVCWFTDDESEQERLLEKVRTAVLQAENDNRVVWRTLKEDNMSYHKVSNLLESKGLYPLSACSEDNYNYPTLKHLVEDRNPSVRVLF